MSHPTRDWQASALCAQTNPEDFFPSIHESSKNAKIVCESCPVAKKCLQTALENDERYGVWGGTTPGERRRIKAGVPERTVKTTKMPATVTPNERSRRNRRILDQYREGMKPPAIAVANHVSTRTVHRVMATC